MYKEYRPSSTTDTASTPEVWAQMFRSSGRLGLYHRVIFSMDQRWRLIRRYMRSGGRILDAGCGAGEWVAFLNKAGRVAEGLDYSPELVASVKEFYPQYEWRAGVIQALPYADGYFAGVISWGVIEHDEAGPAAALREFHRVVEPGGHIIVTVPIDSERQRLASRNQFPQDTADTLPRAFFQYFMTPGELSKHVSDAGFEVVESGSLGGAALTLLAPEWSARRTVWQRNVLNKLVRLGLFWHPALRNMIYCVGKKRA
jgi:SAM-dependent methyltransferase